ncbi:MAG: DUF6554 family protein [Synechococcus sp.]
MRRHGQRLTLCTLGLMSALVSVAIPAQAASDSEQKGAQVYCFMRSSGNDHTVSWNAAYALIKRQGRGVFKTSPEHASVMITEAVVQDPGTYPDCGKFLGDLFGGNTSTTALPSSTPAPSANTERYSY